MAQEAPARATDKELGRYLQIVKDSVPVRRCGRVNRVVGVVVESIGPTMNIGDVAWISSRKSGKKIC